MGFESRRSSKPHACRTPRCRWLPLVIWPRWREGALWRCGQPERYDPVTGTNFKATGCGQLWRWNRVGFYDPELAWEEVDE